MDAVGEIDRRGSFGELHNAALGCEDVNFVGEQINFYAFDKLQRITGSLLHFE